MEDNLSGLITAEDVRLRLRDIAVSFLNKADASDVSANIDFTVDPNAFATRDVIRQFVEANTDQVFTSEGGDDTVDFQNYVAARNAAGQRILLRTFAGNPIQFNSVILNDNHVGTLWEGISGDDVSPVLLFDVSATWTLGLDVGMRNFNYQFGGHDFTLSDAGMQRPLITGGSMTNSGTYSGSYTLALRNTKVQLTGSINVRVESPEARNLTIEQSEVQCAGISCNDLLLTSSPTDEVNTSVTVSGDVTVDGNLTLFGSYMVVDGDLNVSGNLSLQKGSVLVVKGNLSYMSTATSAVSVSVVDNSRLSVHGETDVSSVSALGIATVELGVAKVTDFILQDSDNTVRIKSTPSVSTFSGSGVPNLIIQGSSNALEIESKRYPVSMQAVPGNDSNRLSVGILDSGDLAGSNNVFEFNGIDNTVQVGCSESRLISTGGVNIDMIGAVQNYIECRGMLTFTMDVATQNNHITCYHFSGIINGSNNIVHTSKFDDFNVTGNNNSLVGNRGYGAISVTGNSNNIRANYVDDSSSGTILVGGANNFLEVNHITQSGNPVYANVTGTLCFLRIGSYLSGYYVAPNSSLFYQGAVNRLP